jgi:hypothetical protein
MSFAKSHHVLAGWAAWHDAGSSRNLQPHDREGEKRLMLSDEPKLECVIAIGPISNTEVDPENRTS